MVSVSIAILFEAIAEADLAPLDVEADLALRVDGEAIRVRSRTNRPLVDLPSMGVALALARRGGRYLPEVASVLAAADLTAGIAIDGTGVAILGAEAEPGVLAGRVVPYVEIREEELARALLDGVLDRRASDDLDGGPEERSADRSDEVQ